MFLRQLQNGIDPGVSTLIKEYLPMYLHNVNGIKHNDQDIMKYHMEVRWKVDNYFHFNSFFRK